MSDLAITAATAITGANTASGDLFPVVDVSASTPKGRSITRDELGTAMVATSALTTALAAKLDKAGGTMTGALVITQGTANAAVLTSTGYSHERLAAGHMASAHVGCTRYRLAGDEPDGVRPRPARVTARRADVGVSRPLRLRCVVCGPCGLRKGAVE